MLRFLSLPELREEASQLATTLLESTGLFEGCEWEIRCWLYPLCRPFPLRTLWLRCPVTLACALSLRSCVRFDVFLR